MAGHEAGGHARGDGVIADPRAYFPLFGYKPHDGQRPVHNSAARYRVASCGRRFGKTTLAAAELTAHAMMPSETPGQDKLYWCVAPIAETSMRVFSIVLANLRRHFGKFIVTESERMRVVKVKNFGGTVTEIAGKTTESPESLLGVGLNGVVIDETSRIRADAWENYIAPCLLDRQGWALFISTPLGYGLFKDLYERGSGVDPEWRSFRAPSWANPQITRAAIDKMYLHGENAVPRDVYRQEFEAEFMSGGGLVFPNASEVCSLDGLEDGPSAGTSYFMGIDLARHRDFTVITIVNEHGDLVHIERHQKMPWDQQEERIREVYEHWGHPYAVADATGEGDRTCESLMQEGVIAEPYRFSTNKAKRDVIDNMRIMMEKGQVRFPTREAFSPLWQELCEYEYDLTDFGNLKMGAPSGRNDDTVVATALALWPFNTRNWTTKKEPEPTGKTWAEEKAQWAEKDAYNRANWFAGVKEAVHPWLQ